MTKKTTTTRLNCVIIADFIDALLSSMVAVFGFTDTTGKYYNNHNYYNKQLQHRTTTTAIITQTS